MKGYFYLSILALLFTPAVGVGQILTCDDTEYPRSIGRCKVKLLECKFKNSPEKNSWDRNCGTIASVCDERNKVKFFTLTCQPAEGGITFELDGGGQLPIGFNLSDKLGDKLNECCSSDTRNRSNEQDNHDFTSY